MKQNKLFTLVVFITIVLASQAQNDANKESYYYSNGQVKFEYSKKNGVNHGDYKAYYLSGQIRAEGNYVEGELEGNFKHYTPSGQLASESIFKKGWEVEKKIYWQIVEEPEEFLFVSKEGFYTIKNGKVLELDESTPDNIISIKFDIKTGNQVLYIWRDGKMELYNKK